MCTATWSSEATRVELCFSRDERRSRARPEPPRVWSELGKRVVAPIDPEGGGTWLLANEHGLCLCVLNYYEASSPSSGVVDRLVSRGQLPLRLAASLSAAEAVERASGFDFKAFRPFHLCAIDRGGAWIATWDGLKFERRSGSSGILTTSSFNGAAVEEYRMQRFAEMRSLYPTFDRQSRLAFHRDAAHENPAFNPLMDRPDARTQSHTLIEVGDAAVKMTYWERADGLSWHPAVETGIALER